MKLTYAETERFSQLLGKLSKRYKTLPADLETAKKAAIELLHIQHLDNQSCFKLQGFIVDQCEIYKVRKFACRSLRGTGNRSGIRLIYAYHPKSKRIVFLDIYYKGDRGTENKQCIEDYIKGLK